MEHNMGMQRIHVPMSDETRSQLQALADARGGSLAAVCRDLLEEVAPIAADMAKALETAKKAPARALQQMSDLLDVQVAQADQMRLELDTKKKPRKYKKAS